MKKLVLALLIGISGNNIFAQITLPRLVRDSMVLQRNAKINIWGWAAANEKITVKFKGKTYRSTTGKDKKWLLQLAPSEPGGPYTMDIYGSNKITLKEVLVGDVWFCSGQSNMVHQLNIHDVIYAAEIANANNPQIRQFWVPTLTNLQAAQEDLPTGFWKAAVGEDVRPFSAVAYFFAKKLFEKYNVPIGIINASVGGTPIEAWTSEEGLTDFPLLRATIDKNKDTAYVNAINRKSFVGNRNPTIKDKGLSENIKWFDPTYVPKGWHTINVPGYWEDQGLKDLNGVVWYRKEIDLPANISGKPGKVFLGRIVDADALYINGKFISNTTYQYPQRRYPVAANVLQPGKNTFVVKVTNTNGKGGFVPDKPYYLTIENGTFDLKGTWQYKVGEVYIPRSGPLGGGGINAQNQPNALYNAMVAPLVNFTIKGFVWYQGEANTGRAEEYAKLQPAQIADWRSKWKQGDLPFLYVQLPGFMDYNYVPSESQWATLRESQLKTLSIANTGMAVAIDLGEWNDIHPDRKKEVGERLALLAQKMAYGETLVSSGPTFQSAMVEADKIKISFTNTGAGLVTNDGEPLSEFAIAGADKKFVWAKAIIEGDKIIVSSNEVTAPMYVRYAWADNPVNPNLFNREGLPASPFRTDK